MSRLYMLVGDHLSAVNEAHSLYSLCQTAPVATEEELRKAKAYLRSLGLVVGDSGRLVERKKVPAKDPTLATKRLIAAGDLSGAMKLLRGRKGPTASLYRVWIELSHALNAGNDADGLAAVRKLHDRLGGKLELEGSSPGERAPKRETKVPAGDQVPTREDPLAVFMGMKSLPRKRDPRVRLLERYVRKHPARLDELVAVALEAHVAVEGIKRTAPWLAGFVARALVKEPTGKTRSCVDALLEKGAYAATAYGEAGAKRGITLLGVALESGWEYQDFRRGVLRDEGLEGLKVWTLRLAKDSSERLVAVIAVGFGDLELELQARVLDSVRHISSAALLWLEQEQPTVQKLAEEKGIPCCVSGEMSEVLEALAAVHSVEPPKQSGRKPSALATALRAPEPPSVEALLPLVETYRRTYKSFEACRGLLTDASLSDPQARMATFLRAADQVAPEKVRLNEGITVVVQGASLAPEGPIARLLEEESALRRYGGAAVLEILPVGRAVIEAGWSIKRAMVGPTRRERDTHGELGAVGESLWRLTVEAGANTGEIWYTKASGEEVVQLRALLPAERPCLILDGASGDVRIWAAGLDGPKTLSWDGKQGAAIAEVLTEWSKNQAQILESTR
jgi:hypothetical protein